MSARLVFGMGTGRCGTVSLSELLDLQVDTIATHEAGPIPVWSTDHTEAILHCGDIALRDAKVSVDVAWHYICHCLAILDCYPDSKFICLERNRTDYLISAYRKIQADVNPFQNHDGTKWMLFPDFERGVPKFNKCSRDETLQRYYDFYVLKSARLAKRYPDSIRVWPTDVLNDAVGLEEMLRWAGFELPVVRTNIRENVATSIIYRYYYGETPRGL